MDEPLKKALDFANFKQSFAIQRKLLKEKFHAAQIYGHNGGLFLVDMALLNYVTTLVEMGRTSGVILIDINDNPILIEDLEKFKDDILNKYFESTTEYYQKYQELKRSRTVEKLL